jgi:hypothetical protein
VEWQDAPGTVPGRASPRGRPRQRVVRSERISARTCRASLAKRLRQREHAAGQLRHHAITTRCGASRISVAMPGACARIVKCGQADGSTQDESDDRACRGQPRPPTARHDVSAQREPHGDADQRESANDEAVAHDGYRIADHLNSQLTEWPEHHGWYALRRDGTTDGTPA